MRTAENSCEHKKLADNMVEGLVGTKLLTKPQFHTALFQRK